MLVIPPSLLIGSQYSIVPLNTLLVTTDPPSVPPRAIYSPKNPPPHPQGDEK